MEPCKCPRCRKQTCRHYINAGRKFGSKDTSKVNVELTASGTGPEADNLASRHPHTPTEDTLPAEKDAESLHFSASPFAQSAETNTVHATSKQVREVATSYTYLPPQGSPRNVNFGDARLVNVGHEHDVNYGDERIVDMGYEARTPSVSTNTAMYGTTTQHRTAAQQGTTGTVDFGYETPKTTKYDTTKSMYRERNCFTAPPCDGNNASSCFYENCTNEFGTYKENDDGMSCSLLLASLSPADKGTSTHLSKSMPASSSTSIHSIDITVPCQSDLAITLDVSLHDKFPCKEECCEDTPHNLPANIIMEFDANKTTKSKNGTFMSDNHNVQHTVSDATFNKKDSSYYCTKSISDHSSYYSTNKSYCSTISSSRCFTNRFGKLLPRIPPQLIGGHLAGGCDSSQENKPIKQLSNFADQTKNVTSLFRCACSIKSSEFSCVPSSTTTNQSIRPKKVQISEKRNEKGCGSIHCLSTNKVSTVTQPSETYSQSIPLKRQDEEVPSVKKVNIDLREKMKEFESGLIKLKESEEGNAAEKISSNDSFDSEKEVILPGVRVLVGPEKFKSIHIDVTPAELEKASSGIITIPVQLKFKTLKKPSEYLQPSLKYDDKTIKAYYKKQKLLHENCEVYSEYTDEIGEPTPQKITSDMDFIQPATQSQEDIFVKEVTASRPVKKKQKHVKQSEINNNNVKWCHRSTYIEPYLRYDRCISLDNVGVQTDLSLGPNILSESLNPSTKSCCLSCHSKSDKKLSGTTLRIPWDHFSLPANPLDMFPSQAATNERREIFPQPEEIVIETPPTKSKCFSFSSCCKKKQEPTMCARPKYSGGLVVKPTTSGGRSQASSTNTREPIGKIWDDAGFETPEPRPRPYRPPRTFKSRISKTESMSSSLKPTDGRRSSSKEIKEHKPINMDPINSSFSDFDNYYEKNNQQTFKSTKNEKAVQQPPLAKRWSSLSCYSHSSYKFIDHTPSYYNQEKSKNKNSKPLPGQYEAEKINTDENRSKPKEILPKKQLPTKNCCPGNNTDFCMELPARVAIPRKHKFVYLDYSPVHEPYLNKLYRENIVVPIRNSLPWDNLMLPKNIEIRRISNIKLEKQSRALSDKTIQINSNCPSQLYSCPAIGKSGSKNNVKFARSAPIPICQCESKLECSSKTSTATHVGSKTTYNSGKKVMTIFEKPTSPNNYAPLKSPQSLTYSEKQLCNCFNSTSRLATTESVTRKQAEPLCPYANTRKSSSLFLKPDPVVAAFQKCEAELKPVKEALAQVKNNLKNLNMPELDCLFKKDEPVFICKCKKMKTKIIYNGKTQYFDTNTNFSTIHQDRYGPFEESVSSEKNVFPTKRNKGVQKGSSRKKQIGHSHKKNCKCLQMIYPKSTDGSTTSQEDVKHCMSTQTKATNKEIVTDASCPIVKAIKSILLQNPSSCCTRTVDSKHIKMRLRIKPNKDEM